MTKIIIKSRQSGIKTLQNTIIDGIDVSECTDYIGLNMCNDYLDGMCKGHNCQYKQ